MKRLYTIGYIFNINFLASSTNISRDRKFTLGFILILFNSPYRFSILLSSYLQWIKYFFRLPGSQSLNTNPNGTTTVMFTLVVKSRPISAANIALVDTTNPSITSRLISPESGSYESGKHYI